MMNIFFIFALSFFVTNIFCMELLPAKTVNVNLITDAIRQNMKYKTGDQKPLGQAQVTVANDYFKANPQAVHPFVRATGYEVISKEEVLKQQSEIEQKNQELLSLQEQIKIFSSKKEELEKKLASQSEIITQNNDFYNQMSNEIENKNAQILEFKTKINELNEQIANVEHNLKVADIAGEFSAKENEILANQNKQKQGLINSYAEQLEAFKQQKAKSEEFLFESTEKDTEEILFEDSSTDVFGQAQFKANTDKISFDQEGSQNQLRPKILPVNSYLPCSTAFSPSSEAQFIPNPIDTLKDSSPDSDSKGESQQEELQQDQVENFTNQIKQKDDWIDCLENFLGVDLVAVLKKLDTLAKSFDENKAQIDQLKTEIDNEAESFGGQAESEGLSSKTARLSELERKFDELSALIQEKQGLLADNGMSVQQKNIEHWKVNYRMKQQELDNMQEENRVLQEENRVLKENCKKLNDNYPVIHDVRISQQAANLVQPKIEKMQVKVKKLPKCENDTNLSQETFNEINNERTAIAQQNAQLNKENATLNKQKFFNRVVTLGSLVFSFVMTGVAWRQSIKNGSLKLWKMMQNFLPSLSSLKKFKPDSSAWGNRLSNGRQSLALYWKLLRG